MNWELGLCGFCEVLLFWCGGWHLVFGNGEWGVGSGEWEKEAGVGEGGWRGRLRVVEGGGCVMVGRVVESEV